MKCQKKQDVYHLQIKRTNNHLSFYESWEGQKHLEQIVSNRALSRPNTRKSTIVILSIVLIFLIAIGIIILILLPLEIWVKVTIAVLYYIAIIELYFRFLLIMIIKCYQHYASDETRRRCLCIPSCSEYSIQVLKKYLLIVAFKKIYKRLFKTCKGEMYLIDKP